jgi:focal adhesion kinase 1
MSNCWAYKPASRPTFACIKNQLREILLQEQHAEMINNMQRPKSCSQYDAGDAVPPPKPSRHQLFAGSTPNLLLECGSAGGGGCAALSHDSHMPIYSRPSRAERNVTQMLEMKRRSQIQQAKDDTQWLQSQERSFIPGTLLNNNNNSVNKRESNDCSSSSVNAETFSPVSGPVEPCQSSPLAKSQHSHLEVSMDEVNKIELDRTNDEAFKATMTVIASVVDVTRSANDKNVHLYVQFAKTIGENLKKLQTTVDSLLDSLPHRRYEVEMAQKVLNADMTALVSATKLALKYSLTSLNSDYRRDMLQAAHVIAVDSKALLETVDTARRLHIYLAAQNNQQSRSDISPTEAQNTQEQRSTTSATI